MITVLPSFCGDYRPDANSNGVAEQHMATLDIDNAIRSRAYQYWQAEGEKPGRDLDYWLKAEAEVKSRLRPAEKPAPSQVRKPAIRRKAKA